MMNPFTAPCRLMLLHHDPLNTFYFCNQPLYLLRGGLELILVPLTLGIELAEIVFERKVFALEFGKRGRLGIKGAFQSGIFLAKLFVIADNGIDFIF